MADDDVVSQIVMARMLENGGYKVDLVADGRQVIKALESIDYDLVLMDCFMPGMDGIAATQAIRAGDSKAINPDVPIIALTGDTTPETRERCMRAGMTDFVSKPADPQQLLAAITRCLDTELDEESSLQQAEPAPCVGNEPRLQAQVSPDPNFQDTVIDQFLEKVPRDIAHLHKALRREDLAELQGISHRLRGSTAFLGASSLSTRAQALERAARDGYLVLAIRLTRELIRELQKLTAAL